MTDHTALAPLPADERIQAMDVLRGFALCGILLMNIEAMIGPLNEAVTGVNPALSGADRWVDALIAILVQGKFYPLFSLLFGMGFAVMMMRANIAQRPFTGLYLRRTLALLAIGLAHAVLVWAGDVLTSYSLVALLLLAFFRNTPTSRLPKWGLAFMLLPPLMVLALGGLVSLMLAMPDASGEMAASFSEGEAGMIASTEAQRAAITGTSYVASVTQRLDDLRDMLMALLMWGPQLLGLFLLGGWFVRSGAIAAPSRHEVLFRRLRWVAGPIGLAMALLSYAIAPTLDLVRLDIRMGAAMALNFSGGVLLCLGYLAWIVRGLQSATMAPRLGVLAPAGRMALTNYLMQSLVCTWLFSGYGLGLADQLPRAWQLPFVLGFFALQVLLSHWWLARFRYGPMEWLWRAATYLRLPPLRA